MFSFDTSRARTKRLLTGFLMRFAIGVKSATVRVGPESCHTVGRLVPANRYSGW